MRLAATIAVVALVVLPSASAIELNEICPQTASVACGGTSPVSALTATERAVAVGVSCEDVALPVFCPVLMSGEQLYVTLDAKDAAGANPAGVMTWTLSVAGSPLLQLDAAASQFARAHRETANQRTLISTVDEYSDSFAYAGVCVDSDDLNFGTIVFLGVPVSIDDCGWSVSVCDPEVDCTVYVEIGETYETLCYTQTHWQGEVAGVPVDSLLGQLMVQRGVDVEEASVLGITLTGSPQDWMTATCTYMATFA